VNVSSATVDAWKAHVLDCGLCSNAKSLGDLCPIGRHFWQPSSQPVEASVVPEVVQSRSPQSQPQPELAQQPPSLAIDSRMASHMANQVAARVVARASSGAAIAVPMEKTSRAIAFSTAPGVVLRMPERDIEVYGEMQALIHRLVNLAQALSYAISVEEEARRFIKQTPGAQNATENEVALVVRHTRAQFNVGNDERLYDDFVALARQTLRMGDRLGNFMTVDVETRRISRAARTLGVDMQEVIERSSSGVLKLDDETRRVIKPMRLFAIDLQGEIERRIGTP